jgi:hypothetical protein
MKLFCLVQSLTGITMLNKQPYILLIHYCKLFRLFGIFGHVFVVVFSRHSHIAQLLIMTVSFSVIFLYLILFMSNMPH